jgi:hypothetical protein
MASVLIAGRITQHGKVLRPVGDFTVARHSAGRYAVRVPGRDLSFGRVVALVTSEEGTLAHYRGGRHRAEIHTVSADDGTYVDSEVEFVFYRVA